MKTTVKKTGWAGLLLGAALALGSGHAAAQSARQGNAPLVFAPSGNSVESANADTVGIISGGVDGTYIRIAADLAAVLDSDRLRVLPVVGKGSVQNVADILYLKGIDVGIVQSDVLAYIEQQKLYPNVQKLIGYVTKLYQEEVHVLARRDIARLSDLAHQKVNEDVRGSGTAMTASILFGKLGIPVEVTNFDQNQALEKLKRGEIAAMVYVVGKPARLFAPLPAVSGLHFLSVPIEQSLLAMYVPTELRHSDYPALVAADKPVDTVAVGSVMAVYNWPPGSVRYRKVARFVDAFFSKFHQFQQAPRTPKWKDVNLAAKVPGWTRFPAAEQMLEREADTGTAGGAQVEFSVFLKANRGSAGEMSAEQKAALFQQFLQWEASRRPTQ